MGVFVLLAALVCQMQGFLPNELDRTVEVINAAYQKQPFNQSDRITRDSLEEILANPENQLFVLLCEQDICGTVLLHGAEISLLSVHPDYQGHGYGQLLLNAAEEVAFRTQDHTYLKVIPLFQEKLVAYYESLGYRSDGEIEELSTIKLERIQERYHNQVYALVLRKNFKEVRSF